MVIGIDHPHIHNGKYVLNNDDRPVPDGTTGQPAVGFWSRLLATKAAIRLWFGMKIGSDHTHTRNGKYAPYVEVCGPQGLHSNLKGLPFLSNQGSHLALVFGMVIGIAHPHIRNG